VHLKKFSEATDFTGRSVKSMFFSIDNEYLGDSEMKRLFVILTITAIITAMMIPVLAASRDGDLDDFYRRATRNMSEEEKARIERRRSSKRDTKRMEEDLVVKKDTSDEAISFDPNIIADVNTVMKQVNQFEGLQAQLDELGKGRKSETNLWYRGALEERLTLGRAVQKQVMAELNIIRKTAAQEGAIKTVAAVDYLILKRGTQLEELVRKSELARKQAIRKKRQEEKEAQRTRRGGSRNLRSRSRLDDRFRR